MHRARFWSVLSQAMNKVTSTEDASGRSPPSVTAEGETLPSDPQRLRYVSIAQPETGRCAPVAQNVLWVRIPLPIDLNHINVWLIGAGDGYIAVDTGMAASMCKDAWQLIEAGPFSSKPLKAVFVTHLHPDHIGLAGWLQERYGIPVLMSERTHELAHAVFGSSAPSGSEVEVFLRSHGVMDLAQLQPLFKPERFARMTSGLPDVRQYVEGGETVVWGASQWSAIRTDGHAEGHLCLYDAAGKVLISGDQVLPTISSNISVMLRNRDTNPLGSYLSSLERLSRLPEDTLVLPSHGAPFYGLQHRVEDLRGHHERQLSKLIETCSEPTTAHGVLSVLFRREPAGMHLFLALGEAIAHLEYLVHEGRMERHLEQGVRRYATLP